MAYISGAKKGSCIFCARRRASDDRKDLVVLRGKHAFVVMNRYPYTSGHLMVAPYRHVGSLCALTEDEAHEVMDLAIVCESLLKQAMHPDGFNMGINMGRSAGAGFPGHVHVHVVPRWAGDTNFMAVAADTKVLPETLRDTYAKLMLAKKHLSAPAGGGRRKR